jgi:hypothetical protein
MGFSGCNFLSTKYEVRSTKKVKVEKGRCRLGNLEIRKEEYMST